MERMQKKACQGDNSQTLGSVQTNWTRPYIQITSDFDIDIGHAIQVKRLDLIIVNVFTKQTPT